MTAAEVGRLAPNLDMWLFRPILADPPLYTIRDLDHLTLDDVMDAHEVLNVKAELARRSAPKEKPPWP